MASASDELIGSQGRGPEGEGEERTMAEQSEHPGVVGFLSDGMPFFNQQNTPG